VRSKSGYDKKYMGTEKIELSELGMGGSISERKEK
jgi:hypothetical protein